MNFEQTPFPQVLPASQPSRRAVLHTVAWAAPAVVAAGAAPAFATTPAAATPSGVAVSHTPVTTRSGRITVSNLSDSALTVTVVLPLQKPEVTGVEWVDGTGWKQTGYVREERWAWTTAVPAGASRSLEAGWSVGPSGGARQVIISVGADEARMLDIEPPFAIPVGRRIMQEPEEVARDRVFAPTS